MGKRLLTIASVALVALLCACDDHSEKPKEELPSEAFGAYLSDWQSLDFEGMYDRLTPEARTKVTKDDFAQRYQKIYGGIEARHIAVTAVAEPEAGASSAVSASAFASEVETETTLQYEVRMDTVAGPIQFENEAKLVKEKVLNDQQQEESVWQIAWDPSLIFPRMQEGDKVRVQTTKGERGEIYDRNGNGLAVNGTAVQLGIVPGKLGDNPESAKAELAARLKITVAEIDKKLSAKWVKPELFVPIAIIDEDEIDHYVDISGVDFQKTKLRVYPFGEAAAHLTGYIGEITAEQLEKLKDKGYASGDLIGKAGLEQVYEDQLRGQSGTRITITKPDGSERAVLAETEATPGKTIRLTIDADLQQTIYDEFKKEASSVAAIEPKTGEILALISTPSYDPNAFIRGVSDEQYAAWNDDPRTPFLNRFTKVYAPGSSFKVLTAAIGLDTGTLDPAKKKSIQGLTWTKDSSWGNYYIKRVHDVNPVDLTRALVYSDNIYFAQAALAVGKDAYAKEAAKFGIGEALPLDYPFKKSQLANDGIRSEIQLADSGYGQGEVAMTPLHVALAFSSLVNDGNVLYPSLTKEDGADHPLYWKEGAMKPETASLLKDDLVQAVSQTGGVGHGAYIPGASIAGKTGTAEIKQTKGGDGTENGWFVGFNAADPKLLIAAMVEDVKGKGGSGYVTPKVKRIFQYALGS